MNILMISPYFWPHVGGVEVHVRKVSDELVRMGHQLTILTTMHDRRLPPEQELGGIKIVRYPGDKIDMGRSWAWRNRRSLDGFDLVHCHDYASFIGLYLPLRLIHPRTPVFVTFHGHEGTVPIPRDVKIMRKLTEGMTAGNLCIGHYIPRWYGTRADRICYGGADEAPERAASLPGAIYVGRLERDTGIQIYMEALKILRSERNIVLPLDIYGDGSLRAQIEEYSVNNGVQASFHGVVEDPWRNVNKDFAFVSGYLSILEAMARGKLVFTVYDNALKRDYLRMMPGADSMMEISSSARGLADSLEIDLSDGHRREAKVARGLDFSKESTWKKVAETYLDLWGA